jgi:hypothetical protein
MSSSRKIENHWAEMVAENEVDEKNKSAICSFERIQVDAQKNQHIGRRGMSISITFEIWAALIQDYSG